MPRITVQDVAGDLRDVRGDAPIVAAAQALRLVRQARKTFLLRWALENRKGASTGTNPQDSQTQADALADPKNTDWSVLYRGSVLDD